MRGFEWETVELLTKQYESLKSEIYYVKFNKKGYFPVIYYTHLEATHKQTMKWYVNVWSLYQWQ